MAIRNSFKRFSYGSAPHVVGHGRWRISRGRKVSMGFRGERNPNRAFRLAEAAIQRGLKHSTLGTYLAQGEKAMVVVRHQSQIALAAIYIGKVIKILPSSDVIVKVMANHDFNNGDMYNDETYGERRVVVYRNGGNGGG